MRCSGPAGVRWDKGGTARAGDYIFCVKGDETRQLVTQVFVHHRILSAVERMQFDSDIMSYTI